MSPLRRKIKMLTCTGSSTKQKKKQMKDMGKANPSRKKAEEEMNGKAASKGKKQDEPNEKETNANNPPEGHEEGKVNMVVKLTNKDREDKEVAAIGGLMAAPPLGPTK
eukprot:13913448-Ditylum_brightwellii.AAC.1